MKGLVWELTSAMYDNTQINKLKVMIGEELPSDFAECLLKNNAGYPTPNVFDTKLGTQHIFNNLLPFDESEDENIFKVYRFISEETEREDILPFARDSFGNYICFDFSENPSTVVFWQHETNDIDAVCKSFTDLINMLYEAK
jgi:hypothetical protein